jgi:MbtH protein
MREQSLNGITFKIIICSHEGGYSIWPVDRENPPGWLDAGPVRASARECLAIINDISDTRARRFDDYSGRAAGA